MPWFLEEERTELNEATWQDIQVIDDVAMSTSEECSFACDGRCRIYEHRPFDCRLYPLDILEEEGSLFWAVFTTCPRNRDMEALLEPVIERLELQLMTPGVIQQYVRQLAVTKETYPPCRNRQFRIIRPFRPRA